jgi:hypothetical protein
MNLHSRLACVTLTALFAVSCSEAEPEPPAPAPAADSALTPGAVLADTPDTDVQREHTLLDAVPDQNGIRRMAILRALDKVTGRAIDLYAPAGVPVDYGTLTITAQYCYTVPPEEPPQTNAFLQIDDRPGGVGDPVRIFSGWMFASSPALHALEHGVYDVWVITCRTDAPPPAPAVVPVVDGPLPEGEIPADMPPVDGAAVPDGDIPAEVPAELPPPSNQ